MKLWSTWVGTYTNCSALCLGLRFWTRFRGFSAPSEVRVWGAGEILPNLALDVWFEVMYSLSCLKYDWALFEGSIE